MIIEQMYGQYYESKVRICRLVRGRRIRGKRQKRFKVLNFVIENGYISIVNEFVIMVFGKRRVGFIIFLVVVYLLVFYYLVIYYKKVNNYIY